jgi:integrase
MNVRNALQNVALEKGLRHSTVLSYQRLLEQAGLLDLGVASATRERVLEGVWGLDNPNTRRACIIAVRSVLGLQIKIPKGVPRRYDLPGEDTLRLALMTSPHEVRGLLMMYGGLRVGEACAITRRDVSGDRLRVDKQVQQLTETGKPTTVRIGPVKTEVGEVVIPHWLAEMVLTLEETVKPMSVRESLRRAGVKVGVRLNPHMLRHWFATTMLERGAPLALVSKQMRHSDIATTLRTYSQVSTEAVHDIFG